MASPVRPAASLEGVSERGINGSNVARCSALAACAALVLASTATAATRYAAPAGSGPAAVCPQADPCSLEDAVEAPAVVAGDDVMVMGGAYALSDRLDIDEEISVGGTASAVPVIIAATPGDAAIAVDAAGSELHDATLMQTGGEPAIRLLSGLIDRVSAESDGAVACEVGASGGEQALLRDSACWTGPASFGASAVTVAQAGAGTRAATLRNVTAWAVAAGGTGIAVAASGGGVASIDARNVIASGSASDVAATAAGGSVATVGLSSSNFATVSSSGGGTTAVTPPSASGNQTAAPELADPAAGDFAEIAGSPTIDAGSADALLGGRDLAGEPRIQGPAPDIGADERDGTPPRTTIESGPEPVVRVGKVTFAFRADEPGASFSCRIDDGEFQPCASPYTTDSLNQGDHVFQVRATDPAGNVETTPAERLFSVDKIIAGANVAARGVQRASGGRVAVVITVRSGEFTQVRAAGRIKAGKKRFRIESRHVTLIAGEVRRLKLAPIKRRASGKIRKAIRRGKCAEAVLNVTFVDLIGNRAISGDVDVKVKARRKHSGRRPR